jgi:ribonuclease R
MLLANQTVAKYVFNRKKPTPAFIYRSHDEPPMDKLLEFAKFCKLMGYPIHIENEKLLRKSFNELASRTKGKPEQEIIQQMSIRTMAKAIYTGVKTSHFGLAFQFYTHFTSPIRRYPDLLAHRILFRLLNDKKSGYSGDEIEIIAQHSSNMEQKAADAERASIKYKLAELLKNHEGEIHEAKITGITEWGIYANLIDFHAEGMIRISEIKFDQFYFVEDKRMLIGKRSKRKYQLGDIITVRIKRAIPSKRSIDLTLLKD